MQQPIPVPALSRFPNRYVTERIFRTATVRERSPNRYVRERFPSRDRQGAGAKGYSF